MAAFQGSPSPVSVQPTTCFDWTHKTLPPHFELTPWQTFMRNLDWSQSPLGLMESWPFQLRQMVLLLTQDPKPAVLYWGPGQINVYNEAYTHLIGKKHPTLQGQNPHVVLDEVWENFDSILLEGRRTGKPHIGDGQMLFYTRYGYLEETYYSWKFLPLLGEDGTVVASYTTVVEVTREILAERRTTSIRSLRQSMAKAQNLTSFWSMLFEGLKSNNKDVPMFMAYSATHQAGSDLFVLEGSSGVQCDHPAAPAIINIRGSEGFAGAMRDSLRSKEPLLLNTSEDHLKEHFEDYVFKGREWRGLGLPSNQVFVCPILSLADDIIGFLIIGLNPKKAVDSDYRDYIRRITDSIDPAKVSSILLTESVKWTESQLQSSEFQYRHFADHAPLGVCRMGSDGLVKYANDAWYSITGQQRKDHDLQAWRKTIHDDDLAMMDSFFDDLMVSKTPATIESRLKKPWSMDRNHNRDSAPTWILASGYVELHNSGLFDNIVCWVTDISAQKAAAKDLKQKMDEALELKRQQENFIDMISHEIRNPLSAMLHCSDEIMVSISGSLDALNAIARTSDAVLLERYAVVGPISLLESGQESARTIVYCIQHQRRVVDDVLTLSKLDSDLLTVSPCPVQPVKVVREALKIFDGQLRSGDMDFNIQEDRSLQDLGVDWLNFDPGRVLQVLMNLVTNAIKFTRIELIRKISVQISASRAIPARGAIRYLPSMERKRPWKDQVTVTDGDQERIYLSLSVTDTGRGITDEQMKALFQRFSQATPKTYAQYGGSGLGLFISRQIAEMLGGAIGVESTHGKGSTFAFYVATHRVPRPESKASFSTLLPASISVSLDAVLFDTNISFLEDGSKAMVDSSRPPPGSQRSLDSNVNGLKILVAEDNFVNQKVLCKQLLKRGFVVIAANNGREALEALLQTIVWKDGGTERKFDIILMDLEMPVMGGIECVRNIRQAEKEGTLRGHVPAIAVTANARSMHAEAAIEAGMDRVTTKPYRIDDLVAEIQMLLHASRRRVPSIL